MLSENENKKGGGVEGKLVDNKQVLFTSLPREA
jgi:hypothetical protein